MIIIELDNEKWQEFIMAIESAPRELPQLKRLLTEPSIFEIEYMGDCELDNVTLGQAIAPKNLHHFYTSH